MPRLNSKGIRGIAPAYQNSQRQGEKGKNNLKKQLCRALKPLACRSTQASQSSTAPSPANKTMATMGTMTEPNKVIPQDYIH
jgi:hypothetical protein